MNRPSSRRCSGSCRAGPRSRRARSRSSSRGPCGQYLGRCRRSSRSRHADRPARDRLGDPLPDAEPAFVLARHQHAAERPLEVRESVRRKRQMKRIVKRGEEHAEEVAGDAEHRRIASGTGAGDLRCALLHVLGGAGSPTHVELVRVAELLTVSGSPWRKSRRRRRAGRAAAVQSSRTTRAVPSTVTVAASPRDSASSPSRSAPDLEDEREEDADEDDEERVADRQKAAITPIAAARRAASARAGAARHAACRRDPCCECRIADRSNPLASRL